MFLIDLKPDPVDGSPLAPYVPALLDRIAELRPERIIVIKADVFDAAYPALSAAGLPVSWTARRVEASRAGGSVMDAHRGNALLQPRRCGVLGAGS